MSDARLGETLYWIQFGTLGLAVVLTVAAYLWTKKYGMTMLFGWLWLTLWAVVNCAVVPAIFAHAGMPRAYAFAPEMAAIGGIGISGWFFGLEIAALIFVVRKVGEVFREAIRELWRTSKDEVVEVMEIRRMHARGAMTDPVLPQKVSAASRNAPRSSRTSPRR